MNIFKSFEIFLREPLSILRARFVQLVSVNSSSIPQSSISVDMLEKKTQITVMNSDKMYNLLQTVMYKQKLRESNTQLQLPEKKQVVIGQLLKRQ